METPFSSAQDLTRFQSDSNLVQFVFAVMIGTKAGREKRIVSVARVG